MSQPVKVFVSYADEDAAFKKELSIQLKLVGMQIPIEVWAKDDIIAGQIRADEIKNALEKADVVLLLVSNNFLVADENSFEVRTALELYKEGKTTIISIILRPTQFTNLEIGKFLALPKLAKPISTWNDKDEAWLDVSEGLKKVFNLINEKKVDSDTNTHDSKNSNQSVPDIDSISNQSNIMGEGNVVLQGANPKGDINITINQSSQVSPKKSSSVPIDIEPDTKIFDQARTAIVDTKVEEAIDILVNYTKDTDSQRYNSLLKILSQFNDLKRNIELRILRYNDIEITKNQIKNSLFSIINDLEKEAKSK